MALPIPPQEPPKLLAAEEILPTMQRIIDEKTAVRNEITRQICSSTASFAAVVRPMIEVEDRTSGEFTVIVLLSFASPELGSRTAAKAALKLATEAKAGKLADGKLFSLIDAVKNKDEVLDGESRRYVDLLWRDFRRCGHGILDTEGIQAYLQSQNAITKLRREYLHNITESQDGCWLAMEDLDGIPEACVQHYVSQTPNADGKHVFIPFKRFEMDTFLKYCRIPAKRRELYVARSRCLQENVSLFKEVITLRHRNACMLGYPNHAAFKLETRMAESVDWVETFLNQLEEELLPLGKKEMDFLMAKKREHLQDSPYPDDYQSSMPPWDYVYYSRLAKEEDSVMAKRTSEYFPLSSVVSGLLATVKSCLGLKFDKLTKTQMALSTWHDDVMGWAVWDTKSTNEDGSCAFVGYLYMDLLSREHKYKGSQDVNLQSSFVNASGARVFPATAIMCSFSHAVAEVTLLTHDDIVSLFHECGHAMHDLLSRTKYTRFHGWNSSPDFNEIPSMLFENWCWIPSTLRGMNRHYTTLDPSYLRKWQQDHPGQPSPPEQLSDGEIELLMGSRYQHTVQWYLSQLFYSRFDMALHSCRSLEECTELDPAKIYYHLQAKIRLQPIAKEEDRGHPEANFTHLLKGHDAGLYSYLSAHVTATNIFSKIFADDPFSQQAWGTYRYGLLAWGSSRSDKELLQDILGGPSYIVKGLFSSLQS